jgi:glycosyltransferase involved in cell wall biosynthesis
VTTGRSDAADRDAAGGSPGPGTSRHLLTVVHSLERTGPPLLALSFLRWLRRTRPDWRLTTWSLGGSEELRRDFEALGPVVVAATADPTAPGLRGARARAINRRTSQRLAAAGPVDVAHVHCAGSMRALDVLRPPLVVCHLHELGIGLDRDVRTRAAAHLGTADRYVAVSDAVVAAFTDRHPRCRDRVVRRWGFVEVAPPPAPTPPADLDLAGDGPLVVGAGVRHWRKAPELFVRVAARLLAADPGTGWRFAWVGGEDRGDLARLVDEAGLGDAVRLLDHRADADRWIAAADVVLHTAREDAFPLVCVEAVAAGRPLVAFDDGGAAELVRAVGAGAVVPFPDVDGLVEALRSLGGDPDRRRRWGAAGAAFASRHLVVDVAGPELLGVLDPGGPGR